MAKMERDIKKILSLLSEAHKNAVCELDFQDNLQLLIAVILSAQCTDKRVNIVTKDLFTRYSSLDDFATADILELEAIIKPCGFYHNKAKNILACARDIKDKFKGNVPSTVQVLESLAGVGRKTANVVFAVGFGGEAIAVDTHVFRVSNRIGLANAKNPKETEEQLMKIIPYGSWSQAHHLILHQGRYICKSRSPECNRCNICGFCDYYNLHSKPLGGNNE